MTRLARTDQEPVADKKPRKTPTRARRTSSGEESVEERLSSIYRNEEGSLPDFDQLDRTRSFWWLRTTVWAVVGVCVVSLCAWVGFFLWKPWRNDSAPPIRIQVEAPKQVSPGKEETILVRWENTDLHPIREAEIRVFTPTDFVLQSANPVQTSASSSLWHLGLVQPHQSGVIELRGVFYGSIDREATVQALATYRSSALERERQLTETAKLVYVTSTIDGVLTAPERILPGDVIVLRYQVTNRSDQVLGPLIARFTLPEGFVVSASSSPGLIQEGVNLAFPITRLPPGSMTTLQVMGSELAGHAGEAHITAAVGRTDVRGAFVALEVSEKRSVILAGDLALRLIVNGSAGDSVIESEAPLRVTLGYENTSGEPLKNVSLVLSVESQLNGKKQPGTTGLVNWANLEDVQRAVSSTKGATQTLTLSSTQVPAFMNVPPGAKGSFDWILPLRTTPTGTKEAFVQLTAAAKIERVGNTTGTRDVRVTPLAVRYNTDVNLVVLPRYSSEEGAPVGFGPLPPQVSKTTGYRVTWRLTKKLHDLDGVVVRAKLPSIAAWIKSVTVDKGELTYDQATREVRWQLPAMSLAMGEVSASFDLQITPERADAGRFAPLLGETTFEARDMQLNRPILRVKPAITTDLPDDDVARGRGVVR